MNKHEFDCPIILDLLPLSLENLISKETDEILQAHLLSCDTCRQTYLSMGKDLDFLCSPQCSPQIGKKRKKHHFKRKSRLRIFLLGYILFLLLVLVWVFCGLR